MELTRSFHLPQDFIIACELFHVKPAELLQSFIEYISVYGVFDSHSSLEDPQAIASIFCQNYFLHLQAKQPNPSIPSEKKALHLKHIEPILLAIRKGKKPDATTYTQAIFNWHKEIRNATANDYDTGNEN